MKDFTWNISHLRTSLHPDCMYWLYSILKYQTPERNTVYETSKLRQSKSCLVSLIFEFSKIEYTVWAGGNQVFMKDLTWKISLLHPDCMYRLYSDMNIQRFIHLYIFFGVITVEQLTKNLTWNEIFTTLPKQPCKILQWHTFEISSRKYSNAWQVDCLGMWWWWWKGRGGGGLVEFLI